EPSRSNRLSTRRSWPPTRWRLRRGRRDSRRTTVQAFSLTSRTSHRGLLLALLIAPVGRGAAQAAGDSTVERPKALGAIVISATRTEQALRSLPSRVGA